MKAEFPLVLVEWVDAQGSARSWTPLAEVRSTDRIIQSIGFELEGAHPEHLVLAQNHDTSDGLVGDLVHIPLVNVRSRRLLK